MTAARYDRQGETCLPAEALLEVEGLAIGFRGQRENLVDAVSFRLEAGRTLAIVGESGCGKSLTSLALMGLLPQPPAELSGGRALFEGRDLLALPERERADLRGDGIAMIFQEPMTSLNPAFTIGDQIAEAVVRHRGASRPTARAARARDAGAGAHSGAGAAHARATRTSSRAACGSG